jgi:Ser-tRNA(Ala) deacylase AlaX
MASRPTSETSSRSSTSNQKSATGARAHSAVHVVKGAVANVLGPRKFTFGEAGVLRFHSEADPLLQEVGKIEAAANRKVAEDAEILEFTMEEREAEGHFGTGIYDLTPAPETETLLKIVRIPDWDAGYCLQAHVDSTGSVGAIRVDGSAYDGVRKEVEFRFHLL